MPKQATAPTPDARQKGQEHRERMAARMRDMTASVSDVGTIPKVKNPKRREACRLDLKRFLQTYFPNTTGLSPFSPDHDRIIERIQRCILKGGRFVNAVYRGWGKSTVAENSVIWALIYGHRRFVVLFGADTNAAANSIDSIQSEIEGNDLLHEDFPEVCHPIRALEGKPQRCNGQHHKGKRTHSEWTAERIVLPSIEGSKAGGAVVCVRGITAGFRGMKKKLPDGTQPRPDLIIGDDLQTDETASTQPAVQKTLRTLRKGVAKLGGHRSTLAIVINATVIEPDDAIEQLLADPAWQGERVPMVRRMPDALKTLWLQEYAGLRRTYEKGIVGDQERAHERATAFYAGRRAEMDAGALLSWESCFDPETEISALQHAMNMLIDDGEEAFASECQNQPLSRDRRDEGEPVTATLIMRKLSGVERGIVPQRATRLTAGVDVQQDLLYWAVCAWEENFTGYVIDYGAWPDQRRGYFKLTDARPTLASATKATSLEGAWFQGLTGLAEEVMGRNWEREDSAQMRVSRCLIDCNYQPSKEAVHQFCRNSRFASVAMPSIGMSTTATRDPYSTYKRKAGERTGANWRIPSVKGTRLARHVLMDPNYWKTFLYSRLATQLGDPGSLSLFGHDAAAHRMIADHLTAEYRVQVTNDTTRRTVEIWDQRPGNPDNHLLDCVYGAAVAASIEGVSLDEMRADAHKPKGPTKPLSERLREKLAKR